MKRFILVALVVGMLSMALASTAFAQGPVQGQGIHTPGTGLVDPGTGFGPRGGMAGRGAPAWAGQPDEVQTLLGLTEEQIQAERLAGKSLAQIASEKGVSKADLTSTILNAKKATLDKLVADATITQAQADYAYSRMQQQVPAMIDRTTVGPAAGRGNVRTGAMGRWSR